MAKSFFAALKNELVHRIEAADPYPESYDATVTRNVREQNADARPTIAVTTQVVPAVAGIQGWPSWSMRRTANADWPCLWAVETLLAYLGDTPGGLRCAGRGEGQV